MSLKSTLDWFGNSQIRETEQATIRGLVRASNIVKASAREIVRKRTTNLANSIFSTIDESNLQAFVGTNSEYAKAQEFGLKEYGKGNYGYTPYLRPALKDNKDAVKKVIKDEVKKSVN